MKMNLLYFILSISLCFLSSSCEKENISASADLRNWTEYAANGANTGFLDVSIPREEPTQFLDFDPGEGPGSDSSPILYNKKLIYTKGFSLFCLDPLDGSIKWQFEYPNTLSSELGIFDNTLILGDERNNLYAVNPEDGSNKWSVRMSDDIVSAPSYEDGVLFVHDDSGVLAALDIQTGDDLWVKNYCLTSVSAAVKNGVLYIMSCQENRDRKEQLYAIDTKTGDINWSLPLASYSNASPSIADDILYIGANDGFYAIDVNSQTIKWKNTLDPRLEFESSASIANGIVVAGTWTTASGVVPARLLAFDQETGDVRWSLTLENNRFGVRTAPAISNNNVVIVTADQGGLLAVDLMTGDLLWNHNSVGGFQSASPIITNDRIYYSHNDGHLYGLVK